MPERTPENVCLRDRFGYLLAVLHRRWRHQVDAELAAYGVSQATWRPLIHLASFDGCPRQCDLAEALQIGRPALVRLLDELEDRGLARRAEVDHDRRAYQVQLTAKGRRLAARVNAAILEIERDLMQDLSPADIAVCRRAFAAIEERLADRAARTRPARGRRPASRTRTP